MGALIAFLAGLVARFLGYSFVRFTAQKILLYSLITAVLPAVLITVFYRLIQSVITLKSGIISQYSGGTTSHIIELTGLAAWMANQLRLPDALSLLITGVLFRYATKFIPTVFLP